jgi:hypothetical protein
MCTHITIFSEPLHDLRSNAPYVGATSAYMDAFGGLSNNVRLFLNLHDVY